MVSATPSEQHLASSVDPKLERLSKELQEACANNDAERSHSLIEQYSHALQREAVDNNRVVEEFGSELKTAIRGLARFLYGPQSDQSWQGGADLWQLFSQYEKSNEGFSEAPALQLQAL